MRDQNFSHKEEKEYGKKKVDHDPFFSDEGFA